MSSTKQKRGSKLKIAISSDHGGNNLRKEIIQQLEELGLSYKDFGPNNDDSVDYPDYAVPVTDGVASGEFDRGILICGTGIGMSIAANKHDGIRAACCSDCFSARLTREHNDANVLCMGGRVIAPETACELADIFLHTEFEGGRHERRVNKIPC